MITAMILAGGTGSRVGADRPKQFVEVLGKPVLYYTIQIFESHPLVEAVEIVCHREWIDYTKKLVEYEHFRKVRWITEGGERFQDSVINGLHLLGRHMEKDDIVLVQYGAAPFTSEKIVSDCIRVTAEHGSAFSATPCYQLMGTNDGDGRSKNWVDRDRYVQVACPQGYKLGYLQSIYRRAEEQGLIECAEPHTTSLAQALGDILYQSYGDQTNIKITTVEDIGLFEGFVLMKGRREKEKDFL